MNEQTTALAPIQSDTPTPLPENVVQITPAQARVESVAAALDEAYKQASKLQLSGDEAKALAEDFPDEAFRLGAGGDPNLIYIEHAYLRQRLNMVLGIGACVPIRRREWAEEFQYFKDGRNKTGVRVYVDVALLVRGCLVGEAIGDAVYYPDNAKTNYSDALESAKSNAFRRCAKEFGVGLQAWMKGWGEEWKLRQRKPPTAKGDRFYRERPMPRGDDEQNWPEPEDTTGRAATRQAAQRQAPANKTPENGHGEPKQATPEDMTRATKPATEATRKWMFDNLKQFAESDILAFARGRGILPDEAHGLGSWPLDQVPTSKFQLGNLVRDIEEFVQQTSGPTENNDELPPEIADVVFHIPPAGVRKRDFKPQTIGELYANRHDSDVANRLFGTMERFECAGWTKDDGTKMPPSKEDLALREGLDALKDWLAERDQPQFPDLVP